MSVFNFCKQLLNLALTRKTKKTQHALSAMCGFPIGSVDSFVEKLVRKTFFWKSWVTMIDSFSELLVLILR